MLFSAHSDAENSINSKNNGQERLEFCNIKTKEKVQIE